MLLFYLIPVIVMQKKGAYVYKEVETVAEKTLG
jgi:hypothetical protein